MKNFKGFARDGKEYHGSTAGHEQRLDDLLGRHKNEAYRLAFNLARNDEEAQELVQEASYRALCAWETFDPVQSFKGWYLTIVKNLFLDTRKALSRKLNISLYTPVGRNGDRCLADVLADEETGFLEQLEQLERTQDIRSSLKTLRPEHREVLTLCDLEGRGYENAAREAGVTVGTMKSRLSRARGALRRVMFRKGYRG